MSTELGMLTGKKEIPLGNHSDYIDKELYVTRFYGGKDRGVSLQLTLDHDYIQLSNESTRKLIEILIKGFIED